MKRINKYELEELKYKFATKNKIGQDAMTTYWLDEFVNYCNEEIKTVSRVATINTAEDLFKAEQEISKFCKSNYCDTCKNNSKEHLCIVMYLAEEIEVKE